ncbi:Uncharacterised protein [Mycobacteroides abscessus]|nr:Uncharacterised protein [Mycobacteroides abscessus]
MRRRSRRRSSTASCPGRSCTTSRASISTSVPSTSPRRRTTRWGSTRSTRRPTSPSSGYVPVTMTVSPSGSFPHDRTPSTVMGEGPPSTARHMSDAGPTTTWGAVVGASATT